MLITLKSQLQPISVINLFQAKKSFKRSHPFIYTLGKVVKHNFKQTAFYNFFMIAAEDPK